MAVAVIVVVVVAIVVEVVVPITYHNLAQVMTTVDGNFIEQNTIHPFSSFIPIATKSTWLILISLFDKNIFHKKGI